MRNELLEYRVFPRINKIDGGCWLWTGRVNDKGYGEVSCDTAWRHKILMAHRVVYNLMGHCIPPGYTLDHRKEKCAFRHCVNPAHLEPVTKGENSRRGFSTNKLKTHCPRGHEYKAGAIYWQKRKNTQPSRVCRECKKLRPSYPYKKAS